MCVCGWGGFGGTIPVSSLYKASGLDRISPTKHLSGLKIFSGMERLLTRLRSKLVEAVCIIKSILRNTCIGGHKSKKEPWQIELNPQPSTRRFLCFHPPIGE